MMPDRTFKPCPFCDYETILVRSDEISGQPTYYAVCACCSARGPYSMHDLNKAKDHWNNREGQKKERVKANPAPEPNEQERASVSSTALWYSFCQAAPAMDDAQKMYSYLLMALIDRLEQICAAVEGP